jgi:ubiquinone/menaquinone biosynthesis C-methylase UbiE
MNNEELKALAEQLRQPNGLKGIEIADMMNETNIKMTFHSIDHLGILDNDHILELGHGNCKHLPYVLKQKNKLTYYGLEISELMNNEAKRINQCFCEAKQALFYLYDGQNIPFEDNYFDKIFTVNTIYFWADPKLFITELYRVLKPNGILNITFAQQNFMKQLPFTQFSFTLYNNEKIKQLIDTTPFKTVGLDTQIETVKSKTGDIINREFTTITIRKCPNC